MLQRLAVSLVLTTALSIAAEPGGFNMTAAITGSQQYAVLAPGDIVLPQIANGTVAGGQFFYTVFEAVNLTDSLARIDIVFYDSNGNPMNLPLSNDGSNSTSPSLSGFVQPHGSARAETIPNNASVQVGYAIVTSNPAGAIAVTARFSNRVPGERLYQASIPLETTQLQRFHVAFTNTGNTVSSLAVVSANQQTVNFTVRNFNGQALCNASKAFNAREHVPFILTDVLPCAAGINGIVDVQGQTTGLSGVGFLANDRGLGSFVTQTVYGPRVP